MGGAAEGAANGAADNSGSKVRLDCDDYGGDSGERPCLPWPGHEAGGEDQCCGQHRNYAGCRPACLAGCGVYSGTQDC
ncbi:MAG TPA: hypothetical protein VFC94_05145 [Bacteroidaceae bacterium]|nr:hypothetical protein [Bacteroidaceae bacterium]